MRASLTAFTSRKVSLTACIGRVVGIRYTPSARSVLAALPSWKGAFKGNGSKHSFVFLSAIRLHYFFFFALQRYIPSYYRLVGDTIEKKSEEVNTGLDERGPLPSLRQDASIL